MTSVVLALVAIVAIPASASAQKADLARARALYNERQFDAAIDAATLARKAPAASASAAIVLARAHLERYRQRANPDDLSAARAALSSIPGSGLTPRDRLEFLLALGESLFLEDDFGAAAEIFEAGLDSTAQDAELHYALLEWWASAVDRQSVSAPRLERVAMFERVATRMTAEIAKNPASATASYWMVVALRAAGETTRAWDAAVAGWARARLMGDRTAEFRSDVNRLMHEGIIPDRIRSRPLEQRASAEAQLKADWELVKEKWK
jgi:hypothetical protein